MEQIVSYRVKIRHYNSILKPTVSVYRDAVRFFINVCENEWAGLCKINGANYRMRRIEHLTHRTKQNPTPPYSFDDADKRFYKFPSYLRRAAINCAQGMVQSYHSNLENWEKADPKTRGRKPFLPKVTAAVMPVLYHKASFVRTGDYSARIKVFIRNTWDWIDVELKKSDADYILRHFNGQNSSSPALQRKGKEWFLCFAFTDRITLPKKTENASNTAGYKENILAVDLGINRACTLCCMNHKGTILGRRTLKLPKEEDSLKHALGRIRKAQKQGAKRTPRLWARAKGISKDIAVKTAAFIVDAAKDYGVSTIVFEHLDIRGRKRGSKKQRLHHWRAIEVQRIVEDRAHRNGIRISRVCAWGTSRLAFDGSGPVERGINGNYSICRFNGGKIYDCDLNASYNIGARYFVRSIVKSLSETARQGISANVPECLKRSTCTLSTLLRMNAEPAARPTVILSSSRIVERYFLRLKAASGL